MTRWEYLLQPLHYLTQSKTLERLGESGWEAVCADGGFMLFKRKKMSRFLSDLVRKVKRNDK